MKTNESKNIAIAKFVGFQKTELGWYDNDGVLSLPYTTDNTFDTLLFNKSWDWLLPVVAICKEKQAFETQHLIDKIDNALWSGEINLLFDTIYLFIEKLNKI